MKRNINLVNKQTILTYAGISVVCTIVVFGGVLVGGMRYTKLTDLLIMGIAITITMTLIYTLLSPKGGIKNRYY
ncbi:hypothetical protein R2F61_01135 [Mollicutes bacterium LVI A0078]|nr:hypothetical protein RZE84_01135 [Mollicutes bacterium LVI A0075]WOO91182.1 hypothetical protein R2F61_01135 [Mollicutes bacterium LVI A0078]